MMFHYAIHQIFEMPRLISCISDVGSAVERPPSKAVLPPPPTLHYSLTRGTSTSAAVCTTNNEYVMTPMAKFPLPRQHALATTRTETPFNPIDGHRNFFR